MGINEYKAGTKLIIELAEPYIRAINRKNERPEVLWRIRHFDALTFNEAGLDRLERYSEPQKDITKIQMLANLYNTLVSKIIEEQAKPKDAFGDADYSYIQGIKYSMKQINKMIDELK